MFTARYNFKLNSFFKWHVTYKRIPLRTRLKKTRERELDRFPFMISIPIFFRRMKRILFVKLANVPERVLAANKNSGIDRLAKNYFLSLVVK